MKNRYFVIVTDKNPVIRAEAIKRAKEVCGKCSARLDSLYLFVKVYCTTDTVRKLDNELSEVISPKSYCML